MAVGGGGMTAISVSAGRTTPNPQNCEDAESPSVQTEYYHAAAPGHRGMTVGMATLSKLSKENYHASICPSE